jgi:hypothetical protein
LLLHILSRAERLICRDAEKQDDGECVDRTLNATGECLNP